MKRRYLSFDDRAWATLQYVMAKEQEEGHEEIALTVGSMAHLHDLSRTQARRVLDRMDSEGMLHCQWQQHTNRLGILRWRLTDKCRLAMRSQLGML